MEKKREKRELKRKHLTNASNHIAWAITITITRLTDIDEKFMRNYIESVHCYE